MELQLTTLPTFHANDFVGSPGIPLHILLCYRENIQLLSSSLCDVSILGSKNEQLFQMRIKTEDWKKHIFSPETYLQQFAFDSCALLIGSYKLCNSIPALGSVQLVCYFGQTFLAGLSLEYSSLWYLQIVTNAKKYFAVRWSFREMTVSYHYRALPASYLAQQFMA